MEELEEWQLRWVKFIRGHWQREMPGLPGSYPLVELAQAAEPIVTSTFGVVYLDPDTKKPRSVRPWGGWWWSEPMPSLPGPNQGLDTRAALA